MDVRLTYISCDVTDADDVTNAFEKMALDLRHPIRGLVACAGISDNGPAIDFPASSLRRMLDVNVTGTFLVAQAAAKQMIQANVSGSMVLVASMSGYVSNKAGLLYRLDRGPSEHRLILYYCYNRVSTRPVTMRPRLLYISWRAHSRRSGVHASMCR